jgi:hypothetical protein
MIGGEATQLLDAAQQVPPEAILTSLINDLDSTGKEINLVLDDYQFIISQTVHEAVAFLLEHQPSTFHLAIATRSDPPLPLTRLRARGHMIELRTADLRFTEDEAAQFLNEVMGLHPDAKSVAVLEGRTEGWIAGREFAGWVAAHRKPNTGTRKAGRREIRLGQGTLDQLAAHREERQIQRKLSGDRWEENNQVFPNTLGKTMACKEVKGFRFRKKRPGRRR